MRGNVHKLIINIGGSMQYFRKLMCAIFGHRYYTVPLNNFHSGGSSYFGTYKCQRCQHREDWQYDL